MWINQGLRHFDLALSGTIQDLFYLFSEMEPSCLCLSFSSAEITAVLLGVECKILYKSSPQNQNPTVRCFPENTSLSLCGFGGRASCNTAWPETHHVAENDLYLTSAGRPTTSPVFVSTVYQAFCANRKKSRAQ